MIKEKDNNIESFKEMFKVAGSEAVSANEKADALTIKFQDFDRQVKVYELNTK